MSLLHCVGGPVECGVSSCKESGELLEEGRYVKDPVVNGGPLGEGAAQ